MAWRGCEAQGSQRGRDRQGKGKRGKRKGKGITVNTTQLFPMTWVLDWRLSSDARGAYGGSVCREAAFSHIDHAESAASTRGWRRGGWSGWCGGVGEAGSGRGGQPARPDPAGRAGPSMTGIFTVRIDPRMKQTPLIGRHASPQGSELLWRQTSRQGTGGGHRRLVGKKIRSHL